MTGYPDADGETIWNTSVNPLALDMTNILPGKTRGPRLDQS